MIFKFWQILLLFPLILVLHRFWVRRARPATVAFPLAVPAKFSGQRSLLRKHVFRYAAFFCLLVALARPQSAFQMQQRVVSGVDIMMVLDISRSMAAEDLADQSRLDVAKQTMMQFIQGRANDRIGLVVFSGEPITLAPPTLDYALVIKAMQEAQMGVLKDGTGIGDGLALAVNRLRDSAAKSKIIVLLTDGDNNIGQVGPQDAGELAAGYSIKVYTIAIGKEGRIRIPIPMQGPFGTVMRYQYQDNALNTELLEKIADMTGGKFYRVQDLETLDQVFREIDELERTDVKVKERVQYHEQFVWPLGLALIILFLEQFLFAMPRLPLQREDA